jgi:chemotaxis protein MotB
LLQAHGVRDDQVTQVRGYADQFLRVKSDPYDPSNRRISILVKNQDGAPLPAQLAHAQVVGGAPAASNPPATAKSPSAPAGAKPQTPPSSQPAAPPKPSASQPVPKPPAAQPSLKPSLFGKLTSMLPGAKK